MIAVRRLGRVDYAPTVDSMREFTERRGAETPDEIWICEHPPVYSRLYEAYQRAKATQSI